MTCHKVYLNHNVEELSSMSKMFLGEDISESFGCWEIHVARRG